MRHAPFSTGPFDAKPQGMHPTSSKPKTPRTSGRPALTPSRSKVPLKRTAAKASSGKRSPRRAPVVHGRVRHVVAVDEPRERVGESAKALSIETANGVDELGEQLGEMFVENITGADDAATDRSAMETTEEVGGPFVITTATSEFALGTDASNPPDADREAQPTVSAPQIPLV